MGPGCETCLRKRIARIKEEEKKYEGMDWVTASREKSRNRFRPFSYRKRRHVVKQFD
jgi:hypothetical protein